MVLGDKDLADTPAAKRAIELLRVINLNKEEDLKAYIQANFAVPSISIEEQVQELLSDFHRSKGFIFNKIDRLVGADEITILVENRLTKMNDRFYVKVKKRPPHQIIESSLGDIIIDNKEPITKIKAAEELKNLLLRLSQADVFSGTVLLAHDNNIIFEGAYGEANKDFRVKNNLETKFNLGSINKVFTAIAIAQLVEKNQLSFDDPLSKFMPDFPDTFSAKKIKISHLLAHTSGFGHYMNAKYWASSKMAFKTIDDCLTLAKEDKLSFEPGTKYQYSNTGYLLLQGDRILEKSSLRTHEVGVAIQSYMA
jgi:hypothetical protein